MLGVDVWKGIDIVRGKEKCQSMGAAASVAELEKNVQKNPTYNGPVNFNCADTLAVFATEMIARSPKVEGLQLLLESENGRDAFTQFLRNEYVLDSILVQHSNTPLFCQILGRCRDYSLFTLL